MRYLVFFTDFDVIRDHAENGAIEDPKPDRRDTNAVSTSDLSIKHTSRHTSERHMLLAN